MNPWKITRETLNWRCQWFCGRGCNCRGIKKIPWIGKCANSSSNLHTSDLFIENIKRGGELIKKIWGNHTSGLPGMYVCIYPKVSNVITSFLCLTTAEKSLNLKGYFLHNILIKHTKNYQRSKGPMVVQGIMSQFLIGFI